MKKILSIVLAIGMAVMGAVVPVSASTSTQNTVVYDTLPLGGLGGITGIRNINVPRNIDGNQGTQVFSATILKSSMHRINRIFEIEFGAFENMTNINVAVYIGTERVAERINLLAGDIISFNIPDTVSSGTNFGVVVSSNTAGDNAAALIRVS